MSGVEFWILAYLFNSIWQVPLLFGAGWLAARAIRPAGAVAEHRVWAVVLVLQSLIPAGSVFPWEWLHRLSFWSRQANRAGEAHVSVVMGAATGIGVLQLPGVMLAIVIVYAAVCGYFAARLLWRGVNLRAMRREAVAVVLAGDAALFWARCTKRFAIGDASIAASSRIFGPITMGLRRKVLLLPVSMVGVLPEVDLHTIIAHEFAHMHRRDFTKNLLYELLSLPVTYHPLRWMTRARIIESREMVCDQMAAAMTGRNEYAGSLLRLASTLVAGTLHRTPHTIGIFDSKVFERRVMKLTEKQKEIRGLWRVAMVAGCVALGLATCGSALALGMHANAAPAVADDRPAKPRQLNVSADVMAGNLLTKVMPEYPLAAKKAKVQGTVVLRATISKDGKVENLQVVSGPQELQQSSLDAVRQWTYKPYLLNGDKTEVLTTVNVVYSLAK
jgi:TonB family protein